MDAWVSRRQTHRNAVTAAALKASGLSSPISGLADLYERCLRRICFNSGWERISAERYANFRARPWLEYPHAPEVKERLAAGGGEESMSARLSKSALWFLAIEYSSFHSWTACAQTGFPAGQPTSQKEFQDNGALYFPDGTFKKPDGSPDEHSGDGLAWHLRRLGEPPLSASADNSQPQAYRLIWVGFPGGKMTIIRLKIEKDVAAKIFAKQAPFDRADI